MGIPTSKGTVILSSVTMLISVISYIVEDRLYKRIGRKYVILLNAVLHLIFALILLFGFGKHMSILICAFIGMLFTMGYNMVNTYTDEVSAFKNNAMNTSYPDAWNKMGSTMVGFFIGVKFIDLRFLWFGSILPPLGVIIIMCMMPESPRWLIMKGRDRYGRRLIQRTSRDEAVASKRLRKCQDEFESSDSTVLPLGEEIRAENRLLKEKMEKMKKKIEEMKKRIEELEISQLPPEIISQEEGTNTSQDKAQLISSINTSQDKAQLIININACMAVVDVVRTTLGPRGMDKLIKDDKGNTTISNDGATIMKLLNIIHPAAKIIVDIAKSQDSEVGDGTTMVVLLAGEFLKEAKSFIEDGVNAQNLIKSYRAACHLAVEKIKQLAVSIEGKSLEDKKSLLAKCAATALSSKLIGGEKDFFASMVVDSIIAIGNDNRLNMVKIKKVPGGTMRDSFLVNGVAFKKTFSYARFEQQPKKFEAPKILLLNVELELKSVGENAEIRLSDPSQHPSIVDAEWNIIYDKLDKCVQSGAKIVLSRLAIGDLGTHYFADRGIYYAGRVAEEDLHRVAAATAATVQTSVNNIIDEVLGYCDIFEEKQVGNERFNIFSGCPSGQTATIVLRGGGDQFIEEAERSLHDAIMIVRTTMKNFTVVAGGGAIDMEISRYLRQHARTLPGKSQVFINSYAKALEVIPRQLCVNAGFDATDVLYKLRQKHALQSGGGALYGVDINTGGIADSFANSVWEPAVVKLNAINAATEAACLILSVDQTVKNPKSKSAWRDAAANAMGGRGRGGATSRGGRGMRRR